MEDCAVIGIFPAETVHFMKDNIAIPKDHTFSDAKIIDGDTILLDMYLFVSDPNIFESVFSREMHDCNNPKC